VGASVGVVTIESGSRDQTVDRLHALADHEMYAVKRAKTGGGVRMRRSDVIRVATKAAGSR
jgi:hypothetical protein